MGDSRDNLFYRLRRPGELERVEEPLAEELPHPDYVRLQVAACGICGSDLAFWRGRPGADYPRTLGHEYCGTVVLCGPQASGFAAGDRVAVDLNYRCGQCEYCRTGQSNLCLSSGANRFTGRGFGRYVDLHVSYLRRLPDSLSFRHGALAEPLSCALHAMDLAHPQADDRILILGCGSLGTLLAFALSRLHPEIPLSVYDPLKVRASNLRESFGVQLLSQPPAQPQFTLIFEASGRTLGFRYAARAAAPAGRLVVLSRYDGRSSIPLPADFPRRQGRVIFSHLNGDGDTFARAMDLISAEWQARYDALLHQAPLEYAAVVLAAMNRSPFNKTILQID
ncbi:MAG: hypothetical protein C4524_01230 [Candidatus Zixiibacteriota bacterium]|nr:MAG: hypothetical protein C4524_01230 [candidate division Zixibacteria bacterium]